MTLTKVRFLIWSSVCLALAVTPQLAAQAQDPCAGNEPRALVLGGGAAKGAFEAGAVYYLVVVRGCDFVEVVGVSVGALNGAYMAQAARSDDPVHSQRALAEQAEGLVQLWQGLKGPKDVVRGRFLGSLRFLLGAEHLKDFTPLRKLMDANVELARLLAGRRFRLGVTSFSDGLYYEVSPQQAGDKFPQYLYAGAALPVLARLERIKHGDSNVELQFADGGLRHVVPIMGYFHCLNRDAEGCSAGKVEQLFVIGTSPYVRGSDRFETSPSLFDDESRRITKGSKVLKRALSVLFDTPYRRDLDHMYFANEVLRRFHEVAQTAPRSHAAPTFVEATYQTTPVAPVPQPYRIGLVIPEVEFADAKDPLHFTPATVAQQLYCGCVAADRMMAADFKLESRAEACAEKFPPLQKKGPKGASSEAAWQSNACSRVSE